MFRADFLSEGSKNQRKILLCRFKQCFGAFNMFTAHKCFDTGLFKHLSNPAFCSLTFHKKMNSESHLFFQIIQNFMQIWEMQREIEKIFFDFQIIAFELVALNTRFYTQREYILSSVHMFTNSLKILDTAKTEFTKLIFFHIDKKMRQKHCLADLSSVSFPLTC